MTSSIVRNSTGGASPAAAPFQTADERSAPAPAIRCLPPNRTGLRPDGVRSPAGTYPAAGGNPPRACQRNDCRYGRPACRCRSRIAVPGDGRTRPGGGQWHPYVLWLRRHGFRAGPA
jgi:hypothetical protein